MKTRIHHYSLPASPDAIHDAEDLVIEIDLPFVPVVGMELKVTQEGDFLTVQQVMWAIDKPDVLEVFVEAPDDGADLRPYDEMIAQGWRADQLSH